MNEGHGKTTRGILCAVLLVLLLAVWSVAASTELTVTVSNTTCAQLTITQIIFLQVIFPVHFQIGSIPVPVGQTKTLEYSLESSPTVLQLAGTRDGTPFQATLSIPGSTTFDCGTITVSVGAPLLPPPPPTETGIATLTRWTIPTANARPSGISVGAEGKVFFAAFAGNRIGQLDPAMNQIRERAADGGPFGLYVTAGGVLYYTLASANAVEVMAFDGGTTRWSLPTPNALPGIPAFAPLGPGEVNLWLPQRNTGTLTRFSPSMVPIPMILITTPPTNVSPTTTQIVGVTTTVAPEVYPGNPLLPPATAMLLPTATPPFAEWSGPTAAMRVAVAPNGKVWFTDTAATLSVLDPSSNTSIFYGLPSGTQAMALTVGPNGWVWFTDLHRPAIGVLDPTSADVRLWTLPGSGQPFDLARDAAGNFWFTDRTGNAMGKLNPFTNQVTIYPLPGGSQPLFLTLDAEGRVWFTADQGNYIGRLSLPVP